MLVAYYVAMRLLFAFLFLRAASALTFGVIGDWGDATEKQQRIAWLLDQTSAQFNVNFIVSTGDNFYENGVSSVDDPHFRLWDSYKYNAPWYLVAGNHDWTSSAQPEVEYSKGHPKWNMPAFYYDKTFEVSKDVYAHFVFIDTEILVAGKLGPDAQQTHLRWLEQTLKTSTAAWKIVVGHYPVYSIGAHGPSPYLINNVVPLFKAYGVRAYLSGHDHLAEYFYDSGIAYVVCGDGSRGGDAGIRQGSPLWRSRDTSLGSVVMAYVDAEHLYFWFVMGDYTFPYVAHVPR